MEFSKLSPLAMQQLLRLAHDQSIDDPVVLKKVLTRCKKVLYYNTRNQILLELIVFLSRGLVENCTATCNVVAAPQTLEPTPHEPTSRVESAVTPHILAVQEAVVQEAAVQEAAVQEATAAVAQEVVVQESTVAETVLITVPNPATLAVQKENDDGQDDAQSEAKARKKVKRHLSTHLVKLMDDLAVVLNNGDRAILMKLNGKIRLMELQPSTV